MILKVAEDLCVRAGVVALQFPVLGVLEERAGKECMEDAKSAAHGADFLILDLRHVKTISKTLLGQLCGLFKYLRDIRCQMAVICEEPIREIFEITRLDKLIPVLRNEIELQNLLDSVADLPIIVPCFESHP